jgi:hypothetical protein
MTTLLAILAFVLEHWVEIVAVIGSMVTAASGLANLTPTQSDNKAVAKALRVVDFLALVPPGLLGKDRKVKSGKSKGQQ